MSSEAFEARADQGLLADGGGVHQEPGEAEAPGGEERGGAKQGRQSLQITDTNARSLESTIKTQLKVDDLRGTPMSVGNLEEIIDDNHAIVSTSVGSEHYVSILSFVDKDQLEPGCSVLLNHKVHAVVGVLSDDTDPMVAVMKLEKAPTESYADIGGLDTQIQVSQLF